MIIDYYYYSGDSFAYRRHSANARLRNKDGMTPCELAMRLNHDAIVTCFATYVGVGLLDKLRKQHPSLTL